MKERSYLDTRDLEEKNYPDTKDLEEFGLYVEFDIWREKKEEIKLLRDLGVD